MAAKLAAVPVILSYTHTSKGKDITVKEALDFLASLLPEDTSLVDEEGEIDLSTLAAQAVCKAALRAMALQKDGARHAAGLAPAKVYGLRVTDAMPKETASAVESFKADAAKLAGIAPPAPKAKKAPKAATLADALAATLAAPAKAQAATAVALAASATSIPEGASGKKARKAKAAPVQAPAPVAAPVQAAPVKVRKAKAPKAAPAPVAAPVQAAPVAEAVAAPVAEAVAAPAPGAIDLPALVAWFRADLSRKPSDAIKAHKVSLNRAQAAHKAARA